MGDEMIKNLDLQFNLFKTEGLNLHYYSDKPFITLSIMRHTRYINILFGIWFVLDNGLTFCKLNTL